MFDTSQAIPVLSRQDPDSLSLSRLQIACLLCNAFFSTFPDRRGGARCRGPVLPTINFENLLGITAPGTDLLAKLDCLFTYFDKVTAKSLCNSCIIRP